LPPVATNEAAVIAPARSLVFRYLFRFPDAEREFRLELDPETLALQPQPRESFPTWTRLGFNQCTNCPLREETSPRCPIAANMVDVIEFFQDRVSYERLEVEVEARGRSYSKNATLQEALSSLLGIFMVSSGCPILDRLRPMVATHLPFMEAEESTYRMVSMYLMAQMFVARDGGAPDWDLDGLVTFLEEARVSNVGFCSRLQALGIKDASINALYRLNALGEMTSLSIIEDDLGRWRRVFATHAPRHSPGS
jgi:hypothetical protein